MSDAAFWTRVAPKYAKRPVGDPDAYEQTLDRVRSHLKPGDRVLELGCGTGTTALKLHEAAGSYTASDVAPGMIAIAQEKTGGRRPEFVVSGVAPALFQDREVDTVLAFNLLHLLPDLEGALGLIHGALPEGGLFISKTPAIGGRWYLRPVIAAMRLIGKAPFVRFLTVAEVDRLIRAAGFEIVETGLYPPSVPSRFVVARKIGPAG